MGTTKGPFIVAADDPLWDMVFRYRNQKPMFEIIIERGCLEDVVGLPANAQYDLWDRDQEQKPVTKWEDKDMP